MIITRRVLRTRPASNGMKLILRWLIVAGAFLATAYFIPGITVADFYTALVASFFLGVLSITIRPILFLLTLPITLVTFGLFSFILNAFIFWFLSTIVKGFQVSGFIPALFGSLFVSVVMYIADKLLSEEDKQ